MPLAPFDQEGLVKALMIFILRPWEGSCDVEYDARTGYLKNQKAWSDPNKPVNFFGVFPDTEHRHGVSSLLITRHAPETNYKLKKAIGADPGFVQVGYNLGRAAQLADLLELVEFALEASTFKCERERTLWIPRSFDCRECPHNLACLTKGWEINIVQ